MHYRITFCDGLLEQQEPSSPQPHETDYDTGLETDDEEYLAHTGIFTISLWVWARVYVIYVCTVCACMRVSGIPMDPQYRPHLRGSSEGLRAWEKLRAKSAKQRQNVKELLADWGWTLPIAETEAGERQLYRIVAAPMDANIEEQFSKGRKGVLSANFKPWDVQWVPEVAALWHPEWSTTWLTSGRSLVYLERVTHGAYSDCVDCYRIRSPLWE